MTISLGTNISSLQSQRRLINTGEQLGTVFERLSSGQRINRASDDAAGLAIADSLNARSRIYTQGVRNLNDGLSLFNIADSGLENLTNIIIRLEELAEQSANGVYGFKQREAIDVEAQELKDEFFRLTRVTAFNGQELFTGEFAELNLQGGIGDDAVLQANVGGAIGTGDFLNSTTAIANGGGPDRELSLGDLNGDGLLDLVTAGSDGSNNGYATVRLKREDGSFGSAISFATEAGQSYALELGDLNGDGILDLVTAGEDDSSNGYATVRLGTGDGSFGTATSFTTEGEKSYGLKLGDLNGDGILDLVTAGHDDSFNGYATIRLGTGDGSFGNATSLVTEDETSFDVELGDLNGDGILDLVTVGYDSLTNGGYASVRLGTGDGSFGTATTVAMENVSSHAIDLGDLNGDGILDMVTAGRAFGYGNATVRLGQGDGSFGAATSYVTGSFTSRAVELGDFNGDGILDLVSAGMNTSLDGIASVQLGRGDGSFGAVYSFATEARISNDIALGDLNSDGVLDLMTAGNDDSANGFSTIRLGETTFGVAPLLDFSLATMVGARQALPMFKQKLDQLTAQRGEVGAFQSRIEVASAVLSVSNENFRAAESRIRDADIATESASLTRLNILQQAAASVLAQANQQPSLALQLLG